MLWVLVGVGALWLAFVSPSFRKVALVIIGLIAAIGLWLYSVEKKNEAVSNALATVIPHNQVVFSNVRVQNDYGSEKLVGTVRNDSIYDIDSMVISYEMFNCPKQETPVEQCLSIGKDDDIFLSVAVPSHSARSFDGYMTLNDEAEANGFLKTVYNLVTVRAKG